MVIARDLINPEDRSGVILADPFLHGLLMGQTGRVLAIKNCESRQGDILHGVLSVLASTAIGKISYETTQIIDQSVKVERLLLVSFQLFLDFR